MKENKPRSETARLRALHRYKILDTLPEERFDDITRLASHICGTPIATINFIDENRQWFKSKVGLDLSETSLDVSFCKHAIEQSDVFIVKDVLEDERFANNPFVTSDPNIRFYAGMPLVTSEGYRLGTLCVIDKVPRDLSSNQKEALRTLGRQIMTQLELRRNLEERKNVENALHDSEKRYRALYEDNPSIYFTVDKEGTILSVNRFGAEQLGYTVEELVGQTVLGVFYEDDKQVVLEQLTACLQNTRRIADWELRKVHKDGSILWVREAARAAQGVDGNAVVLIVCENITERKRAGEALRKRTEQIVHYQTELLELAKMDNSYLDQALKRITEVDAKTLGVERVGVWLFNEDRSEIICKEFYKLSENSYEDGSRLYAKDYPNYFRALEESRILAASHARTDPRTSEYTEGYLEPKGITSMMDVPIRLRGEIVGIVCHEHIGKPREWELEDQDFAASIADMVSLALEASERKQAQEALRKAHDELEKRVLKRTAELSKANKALRAEIAVRRRAEDELRIVNSVIQAVNHSLNLEEIFGIALEKIIELEYGDIVGIYLVDEARNEAVLQEHRNLPEEFVQRAGRIPYPKGATWKVINTGKVLNVKNAQADPDVGPAGKDIGFRSMMGIPIALEEKTMGVLWLLSYKEHLFTKSEEDLLTSISRQIAIAVARASAELERKRAEEALKESEGKFRNLVEQTNDWVWETDKNGVFTYVNPKVYEIIGYEPEEILGKTTFDFMFSEEVKRFGEVISSFISMQRPFFRLEKTLIHRDGRLVVFETSGGPIVDSNGALQGYSGIARDVTERKKIEEELLRAQKLESLGVLAGGIAHDFNNLLTAILGNISLVKLYGNPEGKEYKRLTEAEKASLRARDLTQQLLTFSKGGAPVKKVTFIKELIRESASFAQRGSNVKCEFSIAENLWPLEVDEGQISQVINNLVINAQQAMPQGGVIKIIAENVSRGEQTIHLGSTVNGIQLKEGKYVRIMVEDHGIGIPEEHLSKIFDPYFTTKQKGSGLGLAVTYSIIKNHDGYIGVESKLGVGTKLHIYIPVNDSKISELINLVKESPVEGKGRILVMDDEEIVRGVLFEMLSQIGYEVGFARDGSEAIDLYIKAKDGDKPFDVIIMDLTIAGGMGGKEAIKKLLEIDPDVRAIVSSGYSNDPVMSDYMKYGFIGVVNKPYKTEELSTTVHQVLNGA